ncbi:MAG: C4-dicarboxylic acid transporter DauA [Shewanella sp.]
MSHKAHLFSLTLGHALIESCFKQTYTLKRLGHDVLAGLSVGIIAIPLAMALAIASGVAPQYGLYTAIFGGFIIALTGGSSYSISGPTAAFVVLLYPITQQFGLAGLLLATVMSGIILVMMALLKLGRLIQYIPEPVTLGFTAGIGLVIAILQLKDFFGLSLSVMPESFLDKVYILAQTVPDLDLASTSVALITLLVMILWPKLRTPVPAHLPAILIGSLLALALNHYGAQIETIGTRFHYTLSDGSMGMGIPPLLPNFEWPWMRSGPEGSPLKLTWSLIQALLPSAFAIAMLGAIESLLCAVVLDGMTGKRHSSNSELLGQGLGNIIAPLFGGIPATAAIARSAANVKAGAQSPIAAVIHSLVLLSGLLLLTQILAYLPMSAMAALLLVVAWNMSEAPKAWHLLRKAPHSDILVFMTCFSLTVIFDMVIAISVGIVLAALLFMKEIADMTKLYDIGHNTNYVDTQIPQEMLIIKINGPLFFAAADLIFTEIYVLSQHKKVVVLYMDGVSILDAGGLSSLNRLIDKFKLEQKTLVISNLQFQPIRSLTRAKVQPIEGLLYFYSTLKLAIHKHGKLDD